MLEVLSLQTTHTHTACSSQCAPLAGPAELSPHCSHGWWHKTPHPTPQPLYWAQEHPAPHFLPLLYLSTGHAQRNCLKQKLYEVTPHWSLHLNFHLWQLQDLGLHWDHHPMHNYCAQTWASVPNHTKAQLHITAAQRCQKKLWQHIQLNDSHILPKSKFKSEFQY